MEDTWFCIDEDNSSNHSFSDSDAIDSETEAELYSVIHYEENLSNINCSASENKNVQIAKAPASERTNDVIDSKDYCDNSETKSTDDSMPISNNNDANKTPMENEFSKIKFLNNLAQKLSTSTKRKSDSDHQLSDNSYESTSKRLPGRKAFFNELFSNKRQKNDHNEKNLNLTQNNCEDSNSSDSIIWTEVDSTENKNLQLNLCKEENEICLSSDSESDTLLSSNHKNLHLQNLSMPNMKITENLKDKWHINDKDLYRQKRNKSRRYHDDFEVTCSNCNRKGHNARICPVPRDVKCFICGRNNHHGAACLNRLCGHCGNYGHDRRRCLHPLKHCTLCNMNGHSKENCPDLWRRYHLTTEPGRIIQAKQPMREKLSYCWNCGRSGHFGAVCHEFQWYRPFYTTWPCVVSYKNPVKILKERLSRKEQQNYNVRKNAQFNPINKSDVKVVVKTAEQLNKRAEMLKKRAERKKKERRKRKIEIRLQKKIQQRINNIKVEREKDFPRTPKKNSTVNSSEDTVPKVVEVLTKREKKSRNRRTKRFLKWKQILEARRQMNQVNTDNVKQEDR